MELEFLKKVASKFTKQVSATITFISGIVGISIAISPIKDWALVAFLVFFSILLGLISYLYVEKSKAFRIPGSRSINLLSIFDKTHNSWHLL